MKSAGIRYVVPDTQCVSDWRATLTGINSRLAADGTIDPALLDEMLSHLEAFRARQGSTAGIASAGR